MTRRAYIIPLSVTRKREVAHTDCIMDQRPPPFPQPFHYPGSSVDPAPRQRAPYAAANPVTHTSYPLQREFVRHAIRTLRDALD
jgi:hypothetical protein